MVGKTKAATAAERRHIERVIALGCIACRIEGRRAAAEFHHVTDAGRRLGHRYGLPLCAWHHRGQPESGVRPSLAEQVFGPSLARSKRRFDEAYGGEEVLLVEVQRLLERRYGVEEA